MHTVGARHAGDPRRAFARMAGSYKVKTAGSYSRLARMAGSYKGKVAGSYKGKDERT